MSDRLRFGVLGCAAIAVHKVIPAIQRSARGEVVAIASRDAGRAAAAAADLGIARHHGSYEELLADPDVADGLLPYVLLLCAFLFANFAVVLCGAMHVTSEAAVAALIIVTNMFVSVFMFTVGALPELQKFMEGPVPVWNATFWTVLAVEIAIFIIAITLPLLTAARRRDFI